MHFVFNSDHALVNLDIKYKLHGNLRIFESVRARRDRRPDKPSFNYAEKCKYKSTFKEIKLYAL